MVNYIVYLLVALNSIAWLTTFEGIRSDIRKEFPNAPRAVEIKDAAHKAHAEKLEAARIANEEANKKRAAEQAEAERSRVSSLLGVKASRLNEAISKEDFFKKHNYITGTMIGSNNHKKYRYNMTIEIKKNDPLDPVEWGVRVVLMDIDRPFKFTAYRATIDSFTNGTLSLSLNRNSLATAFNVKDFRLYDVELDLDNIHIGELQEGTLITKVHDKYKELQWNAELKSLSDLNIKSYLGNWVGKFPNPDLTSNLNFSQKDGLLLTQINYRFRGNDCTTKGIFHIIDENKAMLVGTMSYNFHGCAARYSFLIEKNGKFIKGLYYPNEYDVNQKYSTTFTR